MSRMRFRGRSRRISRDPGATPLPDAAAVEKAWREYKQTHDATLRNRLVEHYLHLVRFAAERLGAKLPDEVDVDDLMSAGIFGLVDSIDAFDPDRGVKFETFCAQRIRGAILDELRSLDWVPRLVRHRAQQRLQETMRALEVELGHAQPPTKSRVAWGCRARNMTRSSATPGAVSLVSLSQKISDADGREMSEMDVVPDENGADPVIEAQKADIRDLINNGLSRAERLIIVLYYFEQMTMKEIGATLDLSESRVSQMHSAIIERLRDHVSTQLPLEQMDVRA